METSNVVVAVLMGIGLSACAGMRAWMALLIVSILAYSGYLHLNESLSFLARGDILIALCVATVVEVVGDKVPAVDNVLDSIGLVVRPAAGTVVASSLLTDMDIGMAALLGLFVGGGTATVVNLGKSAVRMATTAVAPLHLGIGNTFISFVEDVFAIFTSFMAIILPWLAAGLALLLVFLSIYLMRQVRNRCPSSATA